MKRERMNVVMPEHARRFTAPPYDQFDDEDRVADWGGDDLFTRMPRPRAVDDAPPPRFSRVTQPSSPVGAAPAGAVRTLSLVESLDERRGDPPLARGDAPLEERSGPRDRGRASQNAERAMLERAERLGLAIVPPPESPPTIAPAAPAGSTPPPESAPSVSAPSVSAPSVSAPQPLPIVHAERQRQVRRPAEWIWARPERIVGWAFALGLLLILIAISTADAAAA